LVVALPERRPGVPPREDEAAYRAWVARERRKLILPLFVALLVLGAATYGSVIAAGGDIRLGLEGVAVILLLDICAAVGTLLGRRRRLAHRRAGSTGHDTERLPQAVSDDVG
jgi:hypothetical protein